MLRNRPSVTAVAAVLAMVLGAPAILPAAALAQEPSSPEGATWKLTGYPATPAEPGGAQGAPGTLEAVPLGVAATLSMAAGQATGSGGCNSFGGTYELDGTSLTFGADFNTTLALCDETVQAVEDAYLAALPTVAGWLITENVLQLTDEVGSTLLTFEVPSTGLTSSELAGLVTTLEDLRSDVDDLRSDVTAVNVVRLRDRIKTLENAVASLEERLADVTSEAAQGGNGFTRAEAILLEGIPDRIATRCSPLRGVLPKGTAAAVTCTPDTATVTSVNYFLMDGVDAAAAFQDSMEAFGVAEPVSNSKTCQQGFKSQRVYVGGGWQADGCFKESSKAQLRFVDNATECRQLKVGDRRLKAPAIYMALHGAGQNIAPVWAWATKGLDDGSTTMTSITKPIQRPKEKVSTSCPT